MFVENYLYYVNSKRGHAFEGHQGVLYMRDWRDKREDGNNAIISKICMFYLQKNLAITDKHTCIHYSLCPLFAEDDQMILAPDILDSLA